MYQDEKKELAHDADEVPVSVGSIENSHSNHALKRQLKVGLFLGTGTELEDGGPAGLLLGFCIMASVLYSVMVSLGEMASQFPIPGGQFALAGRFNSPELGFAMGILFWFNYIVVLPAEISAAAVLITYWTPAGQTDSICTTGICNNAMWVGLMLIVMYLVNYAGTRVFGEMEFYFCSIKVITIIGLIIVGIVISAGGGPDHEAIGFKFWRETGGFVQYDRIAGAKGRFLGFFSVLINAAFAFIGSEITAIAAAETADPQRNVPRAIKSVWIRLILFYICSAFMIGILVSPSDPSLNLASTAAKSPFFIAIENAGISVLPSIINAALLTSAWSAGIADLFVSTRTLYGLATRGHAPKIFLKTRKDGFPWVCFLDGSLVKRDSRRWHHSLGNALWHTDSSYHQQRSKYSILLSHGNPVDGGSWTHFADIRRAYEELPESKKTEIEDLIIEHDLWHSRKLASPAVFGNPLPRELKAKPPAFHRLVQVAPDGRKTLYLAAHAKRVLGMSFEESQRLIWEPIDHCSQSKYVFSMEWRQGDDMVWWDNRQSMHRANPYAEPMTARDVRRSTILDDGLLAFGASKHEKLAAEWLPCA
ncbi:hypothetical protein N7488_002638 [Penicillium malachiteum]|nr:hypothetical protein N7488_002638 [Penicillium malachiteum]